MGSRRKQSELKNAEKALEAVGNRRTRIEIEMPLELPIFEDIVSVPNFNQCGPRGLNHPALDSATTIPVGFRLPKVPPQI